MRSQRVLVPSDRAAEVMIETCVIIVVESYVLGPDHCAGVLSIMRSMEVIEAAMIGMLAGVIFPSMEDKRTAVIRRIMETVQIIQIIHCGIGWGGAGDE